MLVEHDRRLRAWTQTSYSILHAFWVIHALKYGNRDHLAEQIVDLSKAYPSNVGFNSTMPSRTMSAADIRLRDADDAKLLAETFRELIGQLLTSLVVLFDECASERLKLMGRTPAKMPGKKVEQIRRLLDRRWATAGLAELVAIRNALVHSNCKWDQRSLDLLRSAGVDPLPAAGSRVEPSIDDLFRYKRAVRTVLNERR